MSNGKRCEFDPTEDRLPECTEPDFVISGSKDVEVYWRSGEYFKNEYDSWVINGVSYVGGNTIYLNKLMETTINGEVIAHEYGHSLGYMHIDGGLMDSGTMMQEDGQYGEDLREETIDICEQMDGAWVIDWAEEGREAVTKLITYMTRGYTRQDDVTYAITKAARGEGKDVLFTSSFNNLGGRIQDKKQLPKGNFYECFRE